MAVAGEYALSYYLSGNTGGPPSPKLYSVTVGGITVPGSTANSAYNSQWTLVTEDVFLNAGSNTLTFASLDSPQNGQNGPVIGGVSLMSVPEPSTWAMMALGFAGVGFAGRRFRGRKLAAI